MKKLRESEKRGRPDIVHFALLEALGSPLNKEILLMHACMTFPSFVVECARANMGNEPRICTLESFTS